MTLLRNEIATSDRFAPSTRLAFRRWLGGGLTAIALLCTGLTVLPLGAVLLHITWRGVRRLDAALLTQTPPAAGLEGGGIANAVVGTGLVVGLAASLAVPVGILAAIYLAEWSGGHPWAIPLRSAVNVLNGVPSILVGVFVYGLLVATGWVGFSAIAGGVSLAVIMLPLVVKTTDDALQQVPTDWRWAAASVGASPAQALWQIILPAATPGILTGVLLAIARAVGETAPLLFTALNSDFFPRSILEPTPTLAVLIYNFATSPFVAQQDLAWAAALVVVGFMLVLSGVSRWWLRRVDLDR